jgi:hypothetical protein
MESYQVWNDTLANHFLQGVARGSRIYLSVDDVVLEAIGQEEFETEPLNGSWREDLINAVRREVVRGNRLDLDPVYGYERESAIPRGVAFLSVCVLAAYEMASNVAVSETNYFSRLRDVLKLPLSHDAGSARPPGMPAGTEEPLWKNWISWLINQGYIPTAQRGQSPNKKFINYPISQCLLRQTDRDRLEKYFYEQKWTSAWDSQTLFSRLRAKTQQFPEYLRKLIKESSDRYEVLSESIQEVHQQWIEAGCPDPNQNGTRRLHTPSSNLFAGLYRSPEDYEIEYYLYPKQKPQHKWDNIQVQYQGEVETLETDRPGWYSPIGNPINSTELDNGMCCKIMQPEHLKTLRLPSRDFWILVPDPDEPGTGVYGTWRSPELGQAFVLLCKQDLMKDLSLLRDERLVNWSNEINPFASQFSQWLELHNFQVLSSTWQGIFIENWGSP